MIPRGGKKQKTKNHPLNSVDGAITALVIYEMPQPQIEVVDLVSAVAADVLADIKNVQSDKALEIDDIVSIVTGGVGCEPGHVAQITNLTTSYVYFKILDGPRSRRARKNVIHHTPSSHNPTERMTSRVPKVTPPRQPPRRPLLSITIC